MATFNERRSYQRCADQASILLSFFNKEDSFKARMINHSFGGVCIKSNSYFQPGTAILIRIKEFASDHSCTRTLEGLPTISLGKVKWCRESTDATSAFYEIGAKFYGPYY
jgi:hypothetical protein